MKRANHKSQICFPYHKSILSLTDLFLTILFLTLTSVPVGMAIAI